MAGYLLEKDGDQFSLKVGGCDCCADYSYLPLHEYADEWTKTISEDDMKDFEQHLREQQELLAVLKQRVGK